MLFLDLSNCGPAGFLKVLYFFKMILDIVFIIVPVALIVLLIFEFSKAIVTADQDKKNTAIKVGGRRILAAVIIFAIPTIVNLFNVILTEVDSGFKVELFSCFTDLTLDAIDTLEADELKEEEAKRGASAAGFLNSYNRDFAINQYLQSLDDSERISGCDGMVYYENGVYYYPASYTNGTAATKGSADYGYNKYFFASLNKMINDAKKAGHTIVMSTSADGAWRSYERQQYFWNCYQTKSCNNGNQAARPGTSKHGFGIASDLTYGNNAARNWAHAHANDYGLDFTVCDSYPKNCSEPWHIAPLSTKSDESVVKKCK